MVQVRIDAKRGVITPEIAQKIRNSTLIILQNIALIFLPLYSPELNAAEKTWAILKRKFTGKLYHTLDEISDFISQAIKTFTENGIKNTCAFDYVFSDINWIT